MSAIVQDDRYAIFRRTKTIDQKELEKYWTGIKATMKGHPVEVS
jgi:hypothetical protein